MKKWIFTYNAATAEPVGWSSAHTERYMAMDALQTLKLDQIRDAEERGCTVELDEIRNTEDDVLVILTVKGDGEETTEWLQVTKLLE